MAPGSIVYQVENCRDLEKRETLYCNVKILKGDFHPSSILSENAFSCRNLISATHCHCLIHLL